MCLMCGMNPEADPLSVYDTHDIGRGSGSGIGTVSLGTAVTGPATVNAPYTWDQIAGYLTDGYWAFNLGSWRAFDIGPSRTITYSLTHLSDAAAAIAEYALDVWAAVTGINFVDVSATPIAITEGADVGGAIGSSFGLSTNSVVSGSISSNGDMDYYRVTLVAGQTYMFSLSRGNGSTLDPVLSLLNSSGSVIATSDDPSSAAAGEYITFTATSTGTYYLVASDYSTRTGTYELTTEVAADLTFNDADGTGAYAWSDLSGNTILSSFINIPDNWDTLNLNGYMVQTYIHELGHALGLGHAGPYNGTANWGTGHTLYDNDSWSATIMSYFDQDTNTFDPASLAYLATIMPADIIAIQNLYGAGSVGYQTGNTIWGPGGNVGGAFQQLLNMWGGLVAANPAIYAGEDFAFTIYDTGGIDTLDVSVFGGGQMVNLNPLVRSNINGVTGNVVIARDTVIENATTGSGNDTVYGNNVANTIRTNGGNDRLYGGAGNDILIGGAGADILDGGAGTDRAHYADATAGIRVDLLSPGSNTGFAAGDTFISIEDVYGSNFNDVILGNNVNNMIWGANGVDQLYGRNGNDTLYGGAGDDILIGGAGADRHDGGTGRDRAHYSDSTVGIRVDLLTPASNTGIAAGDTYVSIEDVYATNFNDVIMGDNVSNRVWGADGIDQLYGRGGNDSLYGGAGDDILVGGLGGDVHDGGTGRDRAHYADATAAVRVDLLSPQSNTGFAAGDTYISIEDVYGSNFNDMLLGDNVSNRIWGANGNDQIYGRNGNDSLYGGAGNDILLGGAGGDLLDGGAGRDRAHYSDATTALRIDLLSPRSNTGIAAGDTYVSIEDVYGSSYNDSIYGDNVSNVIWGADGNDVIYGRVGNDTIYGGNGNDTIRGGEGNDLLYGGAGADAFVFDRPLVGNVDRIADFSSAADTIYLDDAVFTALSTGALASSAFRAGSAATTAAHRIIYNQATGQIFYDADGSGGGAAVLFATVAAGTSIALSDFVVI